MSNQIEKILSMTDDELNDEAYEYMFGKDKLPCYYLFTPCECSANAWPLIEYAWGTLMETCRYDFGLGLGECTTTVWQARMHMCGTSKLKTAVVVYLIMKANEND